MPYEAEHKRLYAGKVPVIVSPLGEQAIVLAFEEPLHETERLHLKLSLYQYLLAAKIPFLLDVIPAVQTITLVFDVMKITGQGLKHPYDRITDWVSDALKDFHGHVQAISFRKLRIPVCYDPAFAPDLHTLAEIKKINTDQVVHLHTSSKYRVLMLGFLPGFAYMGFVHDVLQVGRLARPRRRVQAGSVGIAGKQTGIYPLDAPGGWFIIGRTPLPIFHPGKPNPTLFQPGDEVEFYAITKEEFNRFSTAQYNPLVT
jgi:inhibitor of KinA